MAARFSLSITPNGSPFGKKSGETEPLRNPDSTVIFFTYESKPRWGGTGKKKKKHERNPRE
jgi:hypothetical protein